MLLLIVLAITGIVNGEDRRLSVIKAPCGTFDTCAKCLAEADCIWQKFGADGDKGICHVETDVDPSSSLNYVKECPIGHQCQGHRACSSCLADDTDSTGFQCVYNKDTKKCMSEFDNLERGPEMVLHFRDGQDGADECPAEPKGNGGKKEVIGNGGDCSKNPYNPSKKCKQRRCCFSDGCRFNKDTNECLGIGEEPTPIVYPDVDGYQKIPGLHCGKNKIKIANKKGKMKTWKTKDFQKAVDKCNALGGDCIGVMDGACDASGKFYLCGSVDKGCSSDHDGGMEQCDELHGGDCCYVTATDHCYHCLDSIFESEKDCVYVREGSN